MAYTWPDLDALELLVAVDDRGSLGAASRALGVAQPNASRTIKRLERALGATLIHRTPRGSTLTPEGTVIAHRARDVLARAADLLDTAAALRTKRDAELAVAASMTVAECLLPPWLGSFQRAHPDIRVHLQVHNSMRVFDLVTSGGCALGFVESPTVPAGLHSVTIGRDRLAVVVHPSHPLARRRSPLRVADLAATPLVIREQGSGSRHTLDLALEAYERATPLLELGSSAAIRAAALGAVGPAVLSTLAVADQLRDGQLKEVPVDGLHTDRTLRAVWRPPRRLTGPAAELVKLIQDRRVTPQAPLPERRVTPQALLPERRVTPQAPLPDRRVATSGR
ncbi:LysR family transcriptional regulator [Aldersonia sp. NBC_00410]|uniref:LysR family transcriptional regulator n=1 Tax=Aldersonia sp. NBC_00410 TaxID=2975954 RepID=UPI0022532545|nr:LysR family transcriptional regulator [Aldersonia sp. NBC_00410]MCX5044342.1 LysR family transcriptional regulator [Aldersonia sp. NBC_00410]